MLRSGVRMRAEESDLALGSGDDSVHVAGEQPGNGSGRETQQPGARSGVTLGWALAQGWVVNVFAGHARELKDSRREATEFLWYRQSTKTACTEGAPLPRHCVLPPALTAIIRTVTVAAGRFAPGHLGELTAVVPFELVDAVLAEMRAVQRRLRDLPSRAGVYFLLAMCLFPEVGYRLVWDKLTADLSGMPVACPSAKPLRALRRRQRPCATKRRWPTSPCASQPRTSTTRKPDRPSAAANQSSSTTPPSAATPASTPTPTASTSPGPPRSSTPRPARALRDAHAAATRAAAPHPPST